MKYGSILNIYALIKLFTKLYFNLIGQPYFRKGLCTYTLLQKYTQFCLFMMQNAYVLEGGNEGGREATPTSISIFDFYGIKAL